MSRSELQVEVSDPFLITGTEHGVGVYCFPSLDRMPEGDLILSVGLDRDQSDARRITLRSADGGATWTEDFGPHTATTVSFAALDEHTVFCNDWVRCYESEQEGRFLFAYWMSEDGGRTFGATQIGTLHARGARGSDPYERLSERSKAPYTAGFLKAGRPPLPTYLAPVVERASLKRGASLSLVAAQPDGTLLGLCSYTVAGDKRGSIAVLCSGDRGRTWEFEGFAARNPSEQYGEDAFCEESAMVQFPAGELFCVTRAGSYRPLCALRSADGGATWSDPEVLPIEGVQPRLVLMSDGTLALAAGRPDNVLALSTDRGLTWPERLIIQEWAGVENDRGEIVRRDQPNVPPDNPDLHSTGYNGLAEVEAGKLLYVYDTFSPDEHQPDRWLKRHGHGKVFGRYVTVHG